jgi:nicotinamidase-related amidase
MAAPSPRPEHIMPHTQRALIVIDLQNDYFANGKYPLWNTEAVLDNCVAAIERAQALGMPVILVQHVADSSKGIAPSSMQAARAWPFTRAFWPPRRRLRWW